MRAMKFVSLLLLSVALAFVAPSAHADPSAEAELASAEASYAQIAYDDAIRKTEGLLKTGNLSHEQLTRVYRVLALARAGSDLPEKAREAFTVLLAINPDFTLDTSYSPKIKAPFLEARGFWHEQAGKPGLEASPLVREGEGGTIRVTLRDPTHIVDHAVVGYRWGTTAPFKRVDVAVGDQTVPIPAAPNGTSRLDYFAQAYDARNDAVFEIGNESVPRTTIVDVTSRPRGEAAPVTEEKRGLLSKPAFWIITGVIIAGGVTAGVLLATRKHDTREDILPPTQATAGPTLMCGQTACR